MPVAPLNRYILGGLQPCIGAPMDEIPGAVRIQPGLTACPQGMVLAETTLTQNAVHTLAANTATAGTFTLTFRGFTTTILNFNDVAATVATALNALPSIGAGGVAGSGTAVNGAGLVITWSGAAFANLPIESPVLTIVAAFVTAQPVYNALTTIGSSLGFYGPYIAAGANGLGVPRALLKYQCSTDAAGNTTFGATPTGEDFGQTRLTAPVYFAGTFRIEDIPLATILGITGGFLDNAAVASGTPVAGVGQLGRIVQGSLAGGTGIFRMT